MGISLAGRGGGGVLVGQVQLCSSGSRWGAVSLHMVGRCHLESRFPLVLLYTVPKLRCLVQLFHTKNSGLKCHVEASACGPLWVSETRQGAKRKKFRLFYSDSIFIPWEMLTGFARDKSPEAMLTSGKAVSSPSNNVSKDPFFPLYLSYLLSMV